MMRKLAPALIVVLASFVAAQAASLSPPSITSDDRAASAQVMAHAALSNAIEAHAAVMALQRAIKQRDDEISDLRRQLTSEGKK
jgi:hypothetical protein